MNILVGLETVKSGFDWGDEEPYDRYLFDVQVRYALGLRELFGGCFDLRTLYNFRASVVAYEREHGVNLIARATERITDEQIRRFEVKTGLQRMDSTQIQSNIRRMSRLQLLVEVIGRFHRILDEQEQQQHEGLFGEHYRSNEEQIALKAAKEMSGSTLQSPDDREATYRKKKHEGSRGDVANISETCDAQNELQLITSVSVEANAADDQEQIADDIEGLCRRTDLEELITDG